MDTTINENYKILITELRRLKLDELKQCDVYVDELNCYWCKEDVNGDIVADYACDEIYKIFCTKSCFKEDKKYNCFNRKVCICCNLKGCQKSITKTKGLCHKCLKIVCHKCFDKNCKCFVTCSICSGMYLKNKHYKGKSFVCKKCNKTFFFK